LGAFGWGPSLEAALAYELGQCTREVAAEPLLRGESTLDSQVGLEVHRRAVVRRFPVDVHSFTPSGGSTLSRGRNISHTHGEAFCHPVYVKIIVRGILSPHNWQIVKSASKKYGIPIKRMPGKDWW
jgi:hypothetical protein